MVFKARRQVPFKRARHSPIQSSNHVRRTIGFFTLVVEILRLDSGPLTLTVLFQLSGSPFSGRLQPNQLDIFPEYELSPLGLILVVMLQCYHSGATSPKSGYLSKRWPFIAFRTWLGSQRRLFW
jgi:hypothetical protein